MFRSSEVSSRLRRHPYVARIALAATVALAPLAIVAGSYEGIDRLHAAYIACTPRNPKTIAAMGEVLRQGMLPTHRKSLQTIQNQAKEKFNVTLLSTSRQTAEAKSITYPHEAVDYVDKFTTEKLGMHTTADFTNPSQARADAIQLLQILDTAPAEEIKGITSQVTLADSTLARRSLPAHGLYRWGTNAIALGPGHAEQFWHENGHNVQNRARCAFSDGVDTGFTALNPPHFSYREDQPAENWQGITASQYGASGRMEDYAEIKRQLDEPNSQTCGLIRGNTPYHHKLIAVAADMEQIHPGLGAYKLAVNAAVCNPSF